jgi:hypothetical protein
MICRTDMMNDTLIKYKDRVVKVLILDTNYLIPLKTLNVT